MRLGKVPAEAPQVIRVKVPNPADEALRRRVIDLEGQVKCLQQALKAAFRDSEGVLAEKDAKRILDAVCEYYGLTELDILAQRRQRELVLPRHITMYLMKRLTAQSLPKISRMLKRDHTTVMHGMRKIEHLIQHDDEVAIDVASIMASLQFQEGD